VAENAAVGVTAAELRTTLVEGGVPPIVAYRGVRELASSLATTALQAAIARADRATEVASLQTRLRCTARIEELDEMPPAPVFFGRYWATNTPLVVRGFVSAWPEPPRWSLASLRERFSDVIVEITRGRASKKDPEIFFASLRHEIRFGAFLDLVEGDPGNDAYLVARNSALGGSLAEMMRDFQLPSDVFVTQPTSPGSALWLGPAGTITNLHHDESNTMLCQVLGRKRVRLVPPTMLDVVDSARGFHAMLSATDVETRQPGASYEVTLEERDAVFIPVGWWHEVESLTPSLSLAVVSFRKPNLYGYAPGLPRSQR
jgi:hypothetical protein